MEIILVNIGISVLTGLIFICAGLALIYRPPKEINGAYGYRTKRSMKNSFLWKKGNSYSGKLLIINGILMGVLGSILACIITKFEYAMFTIIGLMFVLIFFLIARVEKKLKSLDK
ncbi:SdpI family protein [Bacillus mycoides]|uniref:SdpI family protein n=1 Tax=Bacillus TaxID=1386 RepID=UPI000B433ED4|nr:MULTISPECIES: SdpI family protein [Bacillus cereus group]MBJ8018427.1 SdpI family protein [Bacillus cereus group sp. N34]MCP9225157.1 SdpI family protein [Bacillus mycoides]